MYKLQKAIVMFLVLSSTIFHNFNISAATDDNLGLVLTTYVEDTNGNVIIEANETITFTFKLKNASNTSNFKDIEISDVFYIYPVDLSQSAIPIEIDEYRVLNNKKKEITDDTNVSVEKGKITTNISELAPSESIYVIVEIQSQDVEIGSEYYHQRFVESMKDNTNDSTSALYSTGSRIIVPTEKEKLIAKSEHQVKDKNSDGIAKTGETLTYTYSVENVRKNQDGYGVNFRDVIIENLFEDELLSIDNITRIEIFDNQGKDILEDVVVQIDDGLKITVPFFDFGSKFTLTMDIEVSEVIEDSNIEFNTQAYVTHIDSVSPKDDYKFMLKDEPITIPAKANLISSHTVKKSINIPFIKISIIILFITVCVLVINALIKTRYDK